MIGQAYLPTMSSAFDLLVAFAIGSFVLVSLAWTLVKLLSSASASMRFIVAQGAMAGLVALGMLVCLLPGMVLFPTKSPAAAGPVPNLDSRFGGNEHSVASTQSQPLPDEAVGNENFDSVESELMNQMRVGNRATQVTGVSQSTNTNAIRISLLSIWSLGCAIVLVRFANSLVAMHRLCSRAQMHANERHSLTLEQAIEDGARVSHRPIQILVSNETTVPFACGIFRPRIVVPEEARTWRPDRLQMVLKHELAHIDRYDVLWSWTNHVACVLAWFNPLVWLLSRRCVIEREQACDDRVLNTGVEAVEYASCLVEIGAALSGRTMIRAGAVAMAEPPLKRRLAIVLSPDVDRRQCSRGWITLVLSVLSVAVALLGMFRPFGEAALAVAAPAQESSDADIVVQQPLPTNVIAQLGSNWFRHAGSVNALAFSPDGQLLASGGSDQYVRIWDLQNAKLVGRFEGETNMGHFSVAFSPDGNSLVAVTGDGRLRLWDLATGVLFWEKNYHGDKTEGYGGGSVNEILPRTMSSGVYHDETQVEFFADGQRIASSGADGRIVITDAKSGETLAAISCQSMNQNRPGLVFAVSPDNSLIAMGSYRDIELVPIDAPEERTKIAGAHGAEIKSLKFAFDGKRLLSCGLGRDKLKRFATAERKLWSLDDQRIVQVYKAEAADTGYTFGHVSPQGRVIATAQNSIVTWDLSSGEKLSQIETGNQTTSWQGAGFALSPDGSGVAMVGEAEVLLWDTETGARILADNPAHAGAVTDVQFSHDGGSIASAGRDGVVRLWDRNAAKLSHTLTFDESDFVLESASVSFSRGDKTLAAAGTEFRSPRFGGTLILWDTASGKSRQSQQLDARATCIKFSESGHELYAAAGIGFAGPFGGGFGGRGREPAPQMHAFAKDLSLRTGSSEVLGGKVIAIHAPTETGTVHFVTDQKLLGHWQPATNRLTKTLIQAGRGALTSAEFSEDGRILALSGLFDDTIYLRDGTTGKQISDFRYDNSMGASMAFSPDSKLLAIAPVGLTRTTTEYAKNVIIWNTETNEQVVELEVSMPHVSAIDFSPNGLELVTGHQNGTLTLWRIPD